MDGILYWVAIYSSMYNVDPMIALSVMQVESGCNPQVIGLKGEVGLMQLMPQFTTGSKKSLSQIQTNIKLGIEKLSQVKQRCKHQKDMTWVICYNRGVTGGSKISNPKSDVYYRKVVAEQAKIKRGKLCSKSYLINSVLNQLKP